jgi:hypothetical protein
MAPNTLLSSKEFIEKGSREGREAGPAEITTKGLAAADRYRFASGLATRISAAAHSTFVQVRPANAGSQTDD